MHLIFRLLPFLLLLLMPSFTWANTAAPAAPNKPEIGGDSMPDAMARILKAPNIDIENLRDPFLSSIEKNRIEEAKRFKNRRKLPGSSRQREVLEYFDLSTLNIVATYKKQGHDWVASIQDSTGKAYTVRRGNYLGKRSGRVEKIDGTTIYLVEQRVNPAGDIVDQQVTLTLSEVND